MCAGESCQPVVTVADCERETGDAKPIAVIARTSFDVSDVDLENIALFDGHVYYVTRGRVTRTSVLGGAPEVVSTVGVDPQTPSTSLVVGAQGAFFEAALGVFRSAKGVDTQLLGPTNVGYTKHLASTPTSLFAVHWDLSATTFTIFQAPTAGGNATPVFTSMPGQFQTLTADADAVYFSVSLGVFRLDEKGGTPTALTQSPVFGGPADLAVDDTHLYASMPNGSNQDDTRFGFVDKKSGGAFTPLANAIALHIETDQRFAYVHGGFRKDGKWNGAIFRVEKTGGEAVIPMVHTSFDASSSGFSWGSSALGVDDQRIYFIESCKFGNDTYGEYRLVTLPKDYVAKTL